MIFKKFKNWQIFWQNFLVKYHLIILKLKLNCLFLILFFFIHTILLIQYSRALTLEKSIEETIANNKELAIEMQKLANYKLQNWRFLQDNLPMINANFNKGTRDSKNFAIQQNYQQNKFNSKELLIEQNIFSGFSSLFNYQKNQLEYLKNLALFNDRKQLLANQIAVLYGKIFYQEKILKNLDQILDFYEKILKNEKLRFKFGVITNLEIQNLETQILKVSQQILLAKSENFNSQQDFTLLSGLNADNLNISHNFDEKNLKFDPQQIENNYLLQAKNLELKILQETQKLNYANSAPKISLQLGFSKQNNNNIYFPNQEIRSKSVGISMVMPIFQQGREYLDFKQIQNNQNIAFDEYNFLKEKLKNELKKDCFELENAITNLQKCWELQKIIEDKINDSKYKISTKIDNINNLFFLEISSLEMQIQCHKNQLNIHNLYYKILANIGGINV